MTPTQNKEYEEQKKIIESELGHAIYQKLLDTTEPKWSYWDLTLGLYEIFEKHYESKLEKVEEEVKQDLENNDIEVELDTKQCSEIALMVYEKYLEWLKKPQSMIIPFNEWVERNLKSNKLKNKDGKQ